MNELGPLMLVGTDVHESRWMPQIPLVVSLCGGVAVVSLLLTGLISVGCGDEASEVGKMMSLLLLVLVKTVLMMLLVEQYWGLKGWRQASWC